MSRYGRQRNPLVERRERSSYIVLQHIHCLTLARGIPLSARRVFSELGLSSNEGFASLQQLAGAGLITWDKIDTIEMTAEGGEYIEWGAGRRRTVRVPTGTRGEGGQSIRPSGGWPRT